MARHKTKDKGDFAVAKTIADFAKQGIKVCLPLSEHLPFDLIAVMPDMTTLRRIQVKYRKGNGTGALDLRFRSNYYDSQKIYSKPVDLNAIDTYAIYSSNIDQVVYFNVSEIPEGRGGISLRFTPTKNNQSAGVRMVEDYVNPQRIANCSEIAPTKQRIVSEKDEIAVSQVIVDLLKQGIQPIIPNSLFVPFDLIGVLSDMQTLYRYCIGANSSENMSYTDCFVSVDLASGTCEYNYTCNDSVMS